MKATAVAPSNVAIVKYWGARDVSRGIPRHPSLSMTLDRCRTRCTVEARPGEGDEVVLAGAGGDLRPAGPGFAGPVREHVERLRRRAGGGPDVLVATRNNFPTGAGLASSASGFAALTVALAAAFGLEATRQELSVLARASGSGSAARSLHGGYVQWPGREEGGMEGPARQLAGPDHWDLRDVIAVVDPEEKGVSSREGHERAGTSPHYETRLELVPDRLAEARSAIGERNPARLGRLLETEAVELHLVAMSSRPPIFYWSPGTLAVMRAIRELREREDVPVHFTVDAGPNVHALCEPAHEERVAERMRRVGPVHDVLRDRVGAGPRTVDEHLL